MTRAEKAGLEAYPENRDYSTLADVMYDYNAGKRRIFIEGYEKGYEEAVKTACEFLQSCVGYVVNGQKCNYENFMKFIEEL